MTQWLPQYLVNRPLLTISSGPWMFCSTPTSSSLFLKLNVNTSLNQRTGFLEGIIPLSEYASELQVDLGGMVRNTQLSFLLLHCDGGVELGLSLMTWRGRRGRTKTSTKLFWHPFPWQLITGTGAKSEQVHGSFLVWPSTLPLLNSSEKCLEDFTSHPQMFTAAQYSPMGSAYTNHQ